MVSSYPPPCPICLSVSVPLSFPRRVLLLIPWLRYIRLPGFTAATPLCAFSARQLIYRGSGKPSDPASLQANCRTAIHHKPHMRAHTRTIHKWIKQNWCSEHTPKLTKAQRSCFWLLFVPCVSQHMLRDRSTINKTLIHLANSIPLNFHRSSDEASLRHPDGVVYHHLLRHCLANVVKIDDDQDSGEKMCCPIEFCASSTTAGTKTDMKRGLDTFKRRKAKLLQPSFDVGQECAWVRLAPH